MKRGLAVLGVCVLAVASYAGFRLWVEVSRSISEDPEVWEEAIRDFEGEDRENPPPADPILFVGSSSIRLWDTLSRDMQPLVTLRRGFGGSKVGDLIHYADRIITPYRPRAVVIFVGTNDLGAALGNVAKSPEQVLELTERLVATIWAAQPEVPIYWLAVKPTSRDPIRWQSGRELNRRVAAWAATEPKLHFVDANEELLTADGSADDRYLMFDGIHLNDAGYSVWAPPIREHLLNDLGL